MSSRFSSRACLLSKILHTQFCGTCGFKETTKSLKRCWSLGINSVNESRVWLDHGWMGIHFQQAQGFKMQLLNGNLSHLKSMVCLFSLEFSYPRVLFWIVLGNLFYSLKSIFREKVEVTRFINKSILPFP